MKTRILPNMTPMRDVSQIQDGDRLFYELGYKGGTEVVDNWISTGEFMEITNVKKFIKNNKLVLDAEYLEHHNFMVVKMEVTIDKNLDFAVTDEVYCNWYTCPSCGNGFVMPESNYCSECGCKFKWVNTNE